MNKNEKENLTNNKEKNLEKQLSFIDKLFSFKVNASEADNSKLPFYFVGSFSLLGVVVSIIERCYFLVKEYSNNQFFSVGFQSIVIFSTLLLFIVLGFVLENLFDNEKFRSLKSVSKAFFKTILIYTLFLFFLLVFIDLFIKYIMAVTVIFFIILMLAYIISQIMSFFEV